MTKTQGAGKSVIAICHKKVELCKPDFMKIQIYVKSPKCFPHPDDVFEIPAFFRMTIKMQEQLDQNDGPLDVVKNLEKTSR